MGGYAQFVEQRDQVRIGPVVEHQEARVDGVACAVEVDVDRVRVTAEIVGGLEQRHAVTAGQQVRAGQARDAGADDGDPPAGPRH